jgi:chromate transporter
MIKKRDVNEMKTNISMLIKLFTIFFRIGLFTVGGGYAMLPMLQREVVEKQKWASEEEVLNYYAIGQSTPGIIAINTATFIGVKQQGVLGGIVGTLGMVTPSLIIIILIANFIENFSSILLVQKAFLGIRVVVVVLILNAVIKMSKQTIHSLFARLVAITSLIAIVFLNWSPVTVILISSVVGLVVDLYTIGGSRD